MQHCGLLSLVDTLVGRTKGKKLVIGETQGKIRGRERCRWKSFSLT